MTIRSRLRAIGARWVRALPLVVEFRLRRFSDPAGGPRYVYQKPLVDFGIQPGDRVLDVGCGTDPFPLATHLVDKYVDPTHHRHDRISQSDERLTIADMGHLPFEDKYFDFVYCSHVLEHADDPIAVSRELMRVGRRGYIETPAFAKDMLFATARGMHRWHLVAIASHLCFFEYSERQLDGVREDTWRRLIWSPWRHRLQGMFERNQDVFNVMFLWRDTFTVHVFRLDGTVEHGEPS